MLSAYSVPSDTDDRRHGKPGSHDAPRQGVPGVVLAEGLSKELPCEVRRPHATGLTSGGEEQVEAEWVHG